MSLRSILRARALKPKAAGEPDLELLCYGDIGESWYGESTSARDVVEQLQNSNAQHVLVRVNSYGGSVSDGLAIYNTLRALAVSGVKVTSRIEGVAASIASLIAMAGDTREMFPNVLLMIHAPWTMAMGNSAQMREMADVLDTYAKAMSTSYARATGNSADDELELLTDGLDHWFTAEEARDLGYATAVLEQAEEPAEEDASASPRNAPVFAAMTRYRNAPIGIAASFGAPILPLSRIEPIAVTKFPVVKPSSNQPAPSGAKTTKESFMNWKATAQSLGLNLPATATDIEAKAAVLAHLSLADTASDGDVGVALAKRASESAIAAARMRADEQNRRTEIASAFAAFRNRPALATLERECMDDMGLSAAAARDKLLARLGEGAEPLNGGMPRVEVGEASEDKLRAAATQAILLRAGVRKDPESKKDIVYDGANPYRGRTLIEVARMSVESMGISSTQFESTELARAALGVMRPRGAQSTSDFPVILENVLHKMVLTGYFSYAPTWQRFCKTGDVTDFREWKRLTPGIIANLESVNEGGEYKNKNLPDAEKLGITVTRKGNIIEVTPETIVNDDLGAIMEMARQLGMAGPRTIERAVYALLAQNSGAGPTISVGGVTGALFSAGFGNIDGAPAALSVTTLAKGADAMAQQTAPGDDAEFLDIKPSVSVSNHAVARDVQVLVDSQYDPDSSNKLQRPNKVRGLVGDIVGSPRVASTTATYLFADPNIAPVIEVAFLNGQREVRVVQEENFRTAGLAWRGELPFGVAAIGYRGGYLLPGA